MRKNHRLTTAKKLAFPTHIIFVDTETTTIQSWQKEHRPELIVGHAQFIILDKELNVVECHTKTFRKTYDYWVWVSNIFSKHVDVTLYAHNWSFDFPTLDSDNHMRDLGYTLKSLVDGCPPIILNYTIGTRKVTYIDSMNYFRSSLKQMGAVIGAEKGDVKFDNKYTAKLLRYCIRDVVILRESILGLFMYLRDNDLSRITHTIASLALSIYLRRFNSSQIMIDGNEERSNVGRQSYFGGRTEAFYLGESHEKRHLIDINSQYPFIMAATKFPYRTIAHYKYVGLNDLIDVMDRYCVTAVVDLDTDIAAYPVKINNRTCFPTGTFKTYLSTPEINYALNHDHIKKVYSIMLYDHTYLFKDYVDYFYNARIQYRKQGNEVWAALAKMLLTNLYGKFGQSHREWTKCDFLPRGYPHTRHEVDYVTKKRLYIMEINNEVFISNTQTEARDSFPAIAAHVTAGARMMLQQTMDFVGHENVFYCDTDSLLLNDTGFNKIKKNLDDDRLGAWGFVDTYDYTNIRGAKDYVFGEINKIKGIKKNAPEVAKGVYQQLQFATLRGCVRSKDLSSPIIRNTTKKLTRKYYKGTVESDGKVSPLVLCNGVLVSKGSAN